MRIAVTVKPNAKKESVEPLPDGGYRVCVKAPPVQGKANEAVVAVLSKYFNVPKSSVTFARGHAGRKKWVDL